MTQETEKSVPDARVIVRDVYGLEKIYPNNETARIFARIAGTKTITPETLELIRALGVRVWFDVRAEVMP